MTPLRATPRPNRRPSRRPEPRVRVAARHRMERAPAWRLFLYGMGEPFHMMIDRRVKGLGVWPVCSRRQLPPDRASAWTRLIPIAATRSLRLPSRRPTPIIRQQPLRFCVALRIAM